MIHTTIAATALMPHSKPLPFHADGHAIAADAPYSKELQRLVSQAFADRKVVAAVGYGVSALLNAKILDAKHPQAGMSILYGKQVRNHCLPAYAALVSLGQNRCIRLPSDLCRSVKGEMSRFSLLSSVIFT